MKKSITKGIMFLVTVVLSGGALYYAKQAYNASITQLKQNRWIEIEAPSVQFGPGPNQIIITFVIRNLLPEDAEKVEFDARVENFDSLAEWRKTNRPNLPPRFGLPLLKAWARVPARLSFGVAPNNPKRHYCGGLKDEKPKPFLVRFRGSWQDPSTKTPYYKAWAFKARCVWLDKTKEADYEKRKYKFFFYPVAPGWFGGPAK